MGDPDVLPPPADSDIALVALTRAKKKVDLLSELLLCRILSLKVGVTHHMQRK